MTIFRKELIPELQNALGVTTVDVFKTHKPCECVAPEDAHGNITP
jgi:hypothetical protein